MGSYSLLTFGHFTVGEWKSHVPLESLLLFVQDDFTQGTAKASGDAPGDVEEYSTYRFSVSAAMARRRADARGLNLALCKRLFDDFRTDHFSNFSVKSGREWLTPNETTFDDYLQACRRVFKKHDSWYTLGHTSKVSRKLARIFSEGFFGDDMEYYFEDAYFCILMRAFLEVVPSDCQVVLDLTDLVHGQYLELPDLTAVYDTFMNTLLRRVGLDYQLYGFVLEEDPGVEARLREKIGGMSEDEFIDHVLLPLFKKMGYQRVRKVESHGRNEFGADILPFRFFNPLGCMEYYAVQAKAVPIHGTSASPGNAGELVSQATQALNVAFVDDIDNERKRIDKFIIATNKGITPDARHAIESAVKGKRHVVLLDIDKLIGLVKQHRLVQYLLFTPLSVSGG